MSEQKFIEEDIEFAFDGWDEIIPFDKTPDYKKLSDTLPHSKGVDFLGVYRNSVYFIEVKDFRAHRIENQYRLAEKGSNLMIEVGQKVKSSLACISGGVRNSTNHEKFWKSILQKISEKDIKVFIILWLEQDDALIKNSTMQARYKANISAYIQTLKTKFVWFTTKVDIRNKPVGANDMGIKVEYLR